MESLDLRQFAETVAALFTINERAEIRELSGNGYERVEVHGNRAEFPQSLADWPQVTHFSYGKTDQEIVENVIELDWHSRRWPLAGQKPVVTIHYKPDAN